MTTEVVVNWTKSFVDLQRKLKSNCLTTGNDDLGDYQLRPRTETGDRDKNVKKKKTDPSLIVLPIP